MPHQEITLPFIRNYRMANGSPRRAVEQCVVRVPVIESGSLVKAARVSDGDPLIEHEGKLLAYYGSTRSQTSIRNVTDRLRMRVRSRMSPKGRRDEAVGDGRAALDAEVRAFESQHVVVEDCIAKLMAPPRIELFVGGDGSVLVTDGVPPEGFVDEWKRRPASAPWMSFPLVERERALGVAEAIARMTRGLSPDGHAERTVNLDIEILDGEAAGRWVDRAAEARFVEDAVKAIVAKAALVAGGFTRPVSALFHDLQDAMARGAAGDDLQVMLEAFVGEVAASPAPERHAYLPWTGFKAAAVAVGARLADQEPKEAPRP